MIHIALAFPTCEVTFKVYFFPRDTFDFVFCVCHSNNNFNQLGDKCEQSDYSYKYVIGFEEN